MISIKKVIIIKKTTAFFMCLTVLSMCLLVQAGINSISYASGVTYYVSVTGDDSRTEAQAQNVNTPWRTIQRAADVMIAGDTCTIRSGTYHETVIPAYSGSSGNPIRFQAYPGETVTISGFDEVTGWTQYSGNIYCADAVMSLGTKNQVVVNGDMIYEARWPNNTGSLLTPTLATMDSANSVSLYDADIQDIDWTGAYIWFKCDPNWTCWSSTVTGYNNRTVSFTDNSDDFHKAKPGGEYFLSGKLEALDTQNEWYYSSTENKLYIWVQGGGSPSSKTVAVKARINSFNLNGRAYIDISNINTTGSRIETDSSTQYCTIDRLTAKYVYNETNCTTFNDQYYDSASGIFLFGSNNEIKNSEVMFSSGNGICVDGSNNRVVNCYIHDTDYLGTYAACIKPNGDHHLISNNTACRTGRSILTSFRLMNSKIQYNDFYNPGYLTKDLAQIYFASCDAQNTEVHHNILHGWASGGGVYADQGCSNLIVHHNVFYDHLVAFGFNLPNEYALFFNNSAYLHGGIGSFYAQPFPNDVYGSRYFNNIDDNLYQMFYYHGEKPEFVTGYNFNSSIANFGADPGFVNPASGNLHLNADAAAKDKGMVIPGITDGYVGNAPDAGAYEYGGTNWIAGHDFSNPPNPSFIDVDTPYMNRVINAGFEYQDFRNWTKTGTQNSSVFIDEDIAAFFKEDDEIRTGHASAMLGTGANGIGQVITGLLPNTSYRLTGWVKVEAGEIGVFGVTDYGGPEIYEYQYVSADGKWQRKIISFKTGQDNTTAKIYLKKITSGTNKVYGDDFGLAVDDSVTPAGTESIWNNESATKALGDGTPHEIGQVFKTTKAGKIKAIKIYSYSGESGDHTARIWRNSDNALIGGPYTINYGGADKWLVYDLPEAIAISPGIEYTVSVSTGTDTNRLYPRKDTSGAGNNGGHIQFPVNSSVFTTVIGTRPTVASGYNNLRDIVFEPFEDDLTDFEDRPADYTGLTGMYNKIYWGSQDWMTHYYDTDSSRYLFINSRSQSEVTRTFIIPSGKVLKSMRVIGPSGYTTVKISSPGNTERVFSQMGTKNLNWIKAADVITVKVTCTAPYGATEAGIDNIVYGDPEDISVDFQDRGNNSVSLTGIYANVDWGSQDWITGYYDSNSTIYLRSGSGSASEITRTFTIPQGKVLKSVRAFGPTGDTLVKISSNGNPERTLTTNSTYDLHWAKAADVITVRITCAGGAFQIGLDDIEYGNPDDYELDFQDRGMQESVLTGVYNNLDWGLQDWRTHYWDSDSTIYVYSGSTSQSEISRTFTIPAGKVLKSLRVFGPPNVTTIKISSTGNDERLYTYSGTYNTNWNNPASVITVKITCTNPGGACEAGLDNITFGDPTSTSLDFEDRGAPSAGLTGVYRDIDWGAQEWITQYYDELITTYLKVNNFSKSEISRTFTLPAGKVLKSIRLFGPEGMYTVKLSSQGNQERTYSSYGTYLLDWSAAAQTVTVKITCTANNGACEVGFDNITFGNP